MRRMIHKFVDEGAVAVYDVFEQPDVGSSRSHDAVAFSSPDVCLAFSSPVVCLALNVARPIEAIVRVLQKRTQ